MHFNMRVLFSLCFFSYFAILEGHNNKPLNYADMESALMPQELDPKFTPDKDGPWRAIVPLVAGGRARRQAAAASELADSAGAEAASTPARTVRFYSRVVAVVTLVAAALVEIIVYFIEYFG